jgi:uncharacterized protein YdeI (YjbR/CyaY-like superfamily)
MLDTCMCAPPAEGQVSTTSGKVLDGSQVRQFRNREAWAEWLEKNYHRFRGLWLRLAKKGSALQSLSYSDALEVALCYGWIDGQKRSDTEQTWLQKFVPRSDNSLWSKIYREKAMALVASGEMKPAGLEAIERAKISGRWQEAYDSPSRAVVSPDLAMALDANPRAKAFFESLDGANRYAVLFRIQTVKKLETRAKKIRQFVEMLARHEKIHASRKPPPK